MTRSRNWKTAAPEQLDWNDSRYKGDCLRSHRFSRIDFYGADRVGDDLFANSLIALNAETGERIWHFRQ
jgi:hypothetical protein